MRKVFFFFLLTFILFLSELGFGANFDKKVFDSPQKPKESITLYGSFNKPGIANPGDMVFSYNTEDKEYPNDPTFMTLDGYQFIGRTGEKTFELKHTRKGFGTKKDSYSDETLKIYFEENATLPLRVITLFSGCEKGSKIDLKMLKLTGNQLEFQIVLPECLEKYIR